MKNNSKEPGYIIVIPFDPFKEVQVYENGHLLVSDVNPLEVTLRDYMERGKLKRLAALEAIPQTVIKHPAMKIEKTA